MNLICIDAISTQGGSTRVAGRMVWRGRSQPRLGELLDDPLVQQVMTRDGVCRGDIVGLFDGLNRMDRG